MFDAQTQQVAHTLELAGNFQIEALSADSEAHFLIEHVPAVNPTRYRVRLYDLARGELQACALRDKRVEEEFLTGLARGSLASPDGAWLFTLYLNTLRNRPFIHALNLEKSPPLCIKLPACTGDLEDLKHYPLMLAPDSQVLYAINPALGIVAKVDLLTFNVVQTAQFEFRDSPISGTDKISRASIITQDGKQVYFTDGWQVWAYDTQTKEVGEPITPHTHIAGLGVSTDGQRLYVAPFEGPLKVFDAES